MEVVYSIQEDVYCTSEFTIKGPLTFFIVVYFVCGEGGACTYAMAVCGGQRITSGLRSLLPAGEALSVESGCQDLQQVPTHAELSGP